MRLVVKGQNGVFTNRGGLVDSTKMAAFPHRDCKDTITEFGFVKDFKIVIQKERYVFFTATPVNAVLPTSEEILEVISKLYQGITVYTIYHMTIVNNHVVIEYSIDAKLSAIDYPLLIITKDADTNELIYTAVINSMSLQYVDDLSITDKIESRPIYAGIKNTIIRIKYASKDGLIKYLMSDKYQLSQTELMRLFSFYKAEQKILNRYSNLGKEICINSKFYTIKDIYTIFKDKILRVNTVLNDSIILEILISEKELHCLEENSEDFDKDIDTKDLHEVINKMRQDSSFVCTNITKIRTAISINIQDVIKDAYDKGYLLILKGTSFDIDEVCTDGSIIRWNALSDFKNYIHYKELDDIIKYEEQREETEKKVFIESMYKI